MSTETFCSPELTDEWLLWPPPWPSTSHHVESQRISTQWIMGPKNFGPTYQWGAWKNRSPQVRWLISPSLSYKQECSSLLHFPTCTHANFNLHSLSHLQISSLGLVASLNLHRHCSVGEIHQQCSPLLVLDKCPWISRLVHVRLPFLPNRVFECTIWSNCLDLCKRPL